MSFNILRTRKGKLKAEIESELKSGQPDISKILTIIDEYESNNLDKIKKLKRGKDITMKKIHGALKQTINAHGPITKELIGSAGKRIYGGLLEEQKNSIFDSIKEFFKTGKWNVK